MTWPSAIPEFRGRVGPAKTEADAGRIAVADGMEARSQATFPWLQRLPE
ncbi:hypothetical protein ACFVH0_01215 [Streptomyces sp. NPDC127117]